MSGKGRRWGGRELNMSFRSLSIGAKSSAKLARIETLKAAFGAILLGFGLIYLAGFAAPEIAHNAAHDSRHALSFPCH
jgi:cobalt transporter subunit CbtB